LVTVSKELREPLKIQQRGSSMRKSSSKTDSPERYLQFGAFSAPLCAIKTQLTYEACKNAACYTTSL
jgi:hypothetical protein